MDSDGDSVWCSLCPKGSEVVPDDSETASTSDEAPDRDAVAEDIGSASLFCSSARHILDWWNVREREGIEDRKLDTRGAMRI